MHWNHSTGYLRKIPSDSHKWARRFQINAKLGFDKATLSVPAFVSFSSEEIVKTKKKTDQALGYLFWWDKCCPVLGQNAVGFLHHFKQGACCYLSGDLKLYSSFKYINLWSNFIFAIQGIEPKVL